MYANADEQFSVEVRYFPGPLDDQKSRTAVNLEQSTEDENAYQL